MSFLSNPTDLSSQTPLGRLQGWVTYNNPTLVLGILPQNFFLDRVNLYVTVAGNAGGTNNVSLGYTGSQQAFFTNTDVSTTGRKTPTLGTATGVNTSSQTITAYFVQTGGAATAGKFFVQVFFQRIMPSP